MITRKELLKSKEFWLVNFQANLFEQVEKYLIENKMSQTEFAVKMGVSKGYISQILNGDFDHKLSKLIELSLAIGKAPLLQLEDMDTFVRKDNSVKIEVIKENKSKTPSKKHFEKNRHTLLNLYSKNTQNKKEMKKIKS